MAIKTRYSCYLCGESFWTLRGQKKHCQYGECPEITKEMYEESKKSFYRILTQVYFIDPKNTKQKEIFLCSYKVDAMPPYSDLYGKLNNNAVGITNGITKGRMV